MKTIAIQFILFFALSINVTAQTEIGGGIYENTTWTVEESPYIVTSSLVVFDNIEITIEPGVELRFNAATNLE
jgi:hypothetical protein